MWLCSHPLLELSPAGVPLGHLPLQGTSPAKTFLGTCPKGTKQTKTVANICLFILKLPLQHTSVSYLKNSLIQNFALLYRHFIIQIIYYGLCKRTHFPQDMYLPDSVGERHTSKGILSANVLG